MRTALDTNVLSALWAGEASAPLIAQGLSQARAAGALVVCGTVYAELLASPRTEPAFVQQFFLEAEIEVDFRLAEAAWTEAGLRFGRYCQRRKSSTGEGPRRLLADYLIGAHALIYAERLMTLDPRRYQQDFPELNLYSVQA